MDKVFCKNCAYLVVVYPGSNGRVEATHEIRQTARCRLVRDKMWYEYVPSPVCHASRRPQWNDLHLATNPEIKGNTEAFIDQISLALDCDSFRPYEPGIGPQQLDEMNTHQATLQVQRDLLALQHTVFDWRQQQAADDQKFSQRIQALEEVRHQETRKDTKTVAAWQLWVAVGAAILAAVVTIACTIITVLSTRPAG